MFGQLGEYAERKNQVELSIFIGERGYLAYGRESGLAAASLSLVNRITVDVTSEQAGIRGKGAQTLSMSSIPAPKVKDGGEGAKTVAVKI